MTSHRAVTLIEEHSLKDGLRVADALIAATAHEAALPLVTGHHKHFRSIGGLAVIPFRAS
jgi:predicted nucleic acid-binding protein